MKRMIPTIAAIAVMLTGGMTVYAAETLDRDYIEAEIWDDMWNGKGDNGLDFPEASYKHHLLDKWLDENYGSDDYDWSELGELKYSYKDYYRDYIEDFDFEDDDNGGWTIDTPEHAYRFELFQGMWNMIDENGDTVDTFPPFSTLEEDEEGTIPAGGRNADDKGSGSPRVIGDVTGGTETASKGDTASGSETTSLTASNGSQSKQSGSGTLLYLVGGIAVVGAGAAGYFVMKKKK